MTNKLLAKLPMALCVAALALGLARPGLAQEGTPTAPVPEPTPTALPPTAPLPTATPVVSLPTATAVAANPEDVLLFSQLGFNETSLFGPFASENFDVDLPSTWALTDGAAVELDLTSFFNYELLTPTGLSRLFGGSLAVSLNDVTLGFFAINATGNSRLYVPISAEALAAAPDGQHRLTLFWDSGIDCQNIEQANLVVRASSRLLLPHAVAQLSLDLADLPQPIFESRLWLDAATVIVPDQPSQAELQAALTVAAGFGNLTSGDLALGLLPASRLAEVRTLNHIIFVGKPVGLAVLGELALPVAPGGAGFQASGSSPEDGVIQLVPSPWNVSKAVLVVSGNSDAAVVKAAQAVSTGAVRTSGTPSVALVASVDETQAPTTVPVNRTLTDLGYQRHTFTSLGTSSTSFAFYVPAGRGAESEAYLDLHFNHSALLNYGRSGLSVSLNGQPIGSLRFTDESTKPDHTVRLLLPAAAIVPGVNRLSLSSALIPLDNCIDPRLASLWLTVWPDSLLHLPLRPTGGGTATAFDLDDYHQPFSRDPGLADTAFVLSEQDPTSWDVAARIAFDLGDASNGRLIRLAAYYGPSVPVSVLQTSHLLLVGRPSDLALIDELKDDLPAPFEPGSNIAVEKDLPVIYRQSPEASVGYLELLASPWVDNRAVLAVLGNTDEGLRWAGDALSRFELRGQLAGNYAVVAGQQIYMADTRLAGGGTNAFDAAAAAGTPQPVRLGDLTGPAVERPWWLLPTLGAALLLILIVAGIGLLTGRRERNLK